MEQTSEAITSPITSGSVMVSGNTILCISGVTGIYTRYDTEPYQITLYQEKK